MSRLTVALEERAEATTVNAWPALKVAELERRGVLLVEDGNHGEYRPRPHEFGVGTMAFIRAADMDGGRVLFESAGRISDTAIARIRKGFGRGGDILFSHKGTVGKLARVPKDTPQFVCSPQTTFWRTLDEDQLDRGFLYSFMRSSAFGDQWNARKGETDMADYVSLTAQRELWVAMPPIDEQRAIGEVLGALDDKIELNRRMNWTLEEMAAALFRSWFEALEVSYVPASNLENERVLSIGDGYRAKNSELGVGGLPFIRAGNLSGGFDTAGAERLCSASVDKAGDKISRVGDVAFTSKGTIGRFARVATTTARFVYSPQVCFWRSLDAERLQPVVMYCWMTTDDFLDQVEAVSGQTDMAPYVSLRDQRRMMVPMFPQSQSGVAQQIEPLLALSAVNDDESRTLAALRDTLLPKLLSGEVRLRDAERAIESAV